MLGKYITPKEFASCTNVYEKDIEKVISVLESKEKDLYVNEENKILLNQESLDKFASILVEDINRTEITILSEISCSFKWDRDRPKEGRSRFWASPLNLDLNLSKLFYRELFNRLISDEFEEIEGAFGYYHLRNTFHSSDELWSKIKHIYDLVTAFNSPMGDFDANHFGDNQFRKYRSKLALNDSFITTMMYHSRSKSRYGYRPKED